MIKDEGIRGDNDRINVITLSMMNLLNVFVILAWYDDAQRHRTREGKVTRQLMNRDLYPSANGGDQYLPADGLSLIIAFWQGDFELWFSGA